MPSSVPWPVGFGWTLLDVFGVQSPVGCHFKECLLGGQGRCPCRDPSCAVDDVWCSLLVSRRNDCCATMAAVCPLSSNVHYRPEADSGCSMPAAASGWLLTLRFQRRVTAAREPSHSRSTSASVRCTSGTGQPSTSRRQIARVAACAADELALCARGGICRCQIRPPKAVAQRSWYRSGAPPWRAGTRPLSFQVEAATRKFRTPLGLRRQWLGSGRTSRLPPCDGTCVEQAATASRRKWR